MTPTTSGKKQILGLFGWLLATLATGGLGGLASSQAASFYGALSRPEWAPPPWLFGPVWSLLYVLMGIAAWLVWRERGFRGASTALKLFVVQLFANALWTWIFFVWRQGALSLIEILVLWGLIAGTLWAFWRLNRLAALLLLPYLAWVSFATALTATLWRLNPAILG